MNTRTFNTCYNKHMEDLTRKKCVPCEGGVAPLAGDALKPYLAQVPEWAPIEGERKIRREFHFKDFKETIGFVNRVARLAEEEGHHPDMFIFYNRLIVELWTHAIGGLSQNDFILAAKMDRLRSDRE